MNMEVKSTLERIRDMAAALDHKLARLGCPDSVAGQLQNIESTLTRLIHTAGPDPRDAAEFQPMGLDCGGL